MSGSFEYSGPGPIGSLTQGDRMFQGQDIRQSHQDTTLINIFEFKPYFDNLPWLLCLYHRTLEPTLRKTHIQPNLLCHAMLSLYILTPNAIFTTST